MMRAVNDAKRHRTLLQRLLTGTLWATLSTVLYRGSLVISMTLAARLLGKEQFGQLGTVLSTTVVLEAVSMFGAGLGTIKHIAEFRTRDLARVISAVSATFMLSLTCSGTLALILYLWTPYFTEVIFNGHEIDFYIRIATIVLVAETIYSSVICVLTGLEKFRDLAILNAILGILLVPSILYGAVSGGVSGVLLAIGLATAIVALIGAIRIRKLTEYMRKKQPVRISTAELRHLAKRGLPVFLTTIINAGTNWAGIAYLAHHVDYAEVGIFSAANQWFSLLLFIPGVIASSFLPVLSEKSQEDGKGDFVRIVKIGLLGIVSINLPMALIVIVASSNILSIYGDEYRSGAPVLMIIAVAAIAASAQNFLGNILIAVNRHWIQTVCNITWALVFLGVAFYSITSGYGAMGLALASLASYSIKTAVTATFLATARKT